jgi:hypothetical protein
MFFSPDFNHYFTKIFYCERGKRMRKMDGNESAKLDYLNKYDNHNRFMGRVYFPNIQCVRLANVLCQNDDMVDRYIKYYYNPEFEQWEVINSLQQLKRDIKSERTDVSEYKEKIKNSIEIKNWSWLWVLLQELFLEVLYKEQVDEIVELIHNKGIDESDIVNWYKKDKKILAMTTFNVEYIKSVTRE